MPATSAAMSFEPTPPRLADAPQRSEFARFLRISLALFLAGFATFSLLYCTQPLLPEFAAEFGLGPAASSLALSLSTVCLAFSILCVGALSESLGRRGLMFCSICLAALFNLAAAFAPGWGWLLLARALEGVALGGVPAVAMAYLAEETPPSRLGFAMGIYVAGTAFGGMSGRVATGFLTAHAGWREAMAWIALSGLVAAVGFVLLLPASRHFHRCAGVRLQGHLEAWRRHLRHPQLPALFMIGFLAMGVFVTLYNYIGFRLIGEPWLLSHAQIGLIFLAYLCGMGASPLAGTLADRWGRAPVVLGGVAIMLAGMLLTLAEALGAIVAGIALLTAGFFATHSVASAWVGRLAASHSGHASSLYLLGYYLGSSMLGSLGGWFWAEGGWPGVVWSGAALVMVVVLLTFYLRHEALHPEG